MAPSWEVAADPGKISAESRKDTADELGQVVDESRKVATEPGNHWLAGKVTADPENSLLKDAAEPGNVATKQKKSSPSQDKSPTYKKSSHKVQKISKFNYQHSLKKRLS